MSQRATNDAGVFQKCGSDDERQRQELRGSQSVWWDLERTVRAIEWYIKIKFVNLEDEFRIFSNRRARWAIFRKLPYWGKLAANTAKSWFELRYDRREWTRRKPISHEN